MINASLADLIHLLPRDCIETSQETFSRRLADWYHVHRGRALALARPRSPREISIILSWANEAKIPVIVQGGNTGLSGGAIPDQSGNSLLLSLERMKTIRWISPEDNAMIVEAGCILAHIQEAALSVDRLFPLSLSTEGSCQIGGNLATNAGGINVLRYGMARDLTLGLEVVLADGNILSDLRPLRKNNSGYDWKQIFIGSEGTLGIISAACLKLFPAIKTKATCFLALRDIQDTPQLLNLCQEILEYRLVSFELLPQIGLDLANIRPPTERRATYYVLAEAAGQEEIPMQKALEAASEKGLVLDAVLAQNERETRQLWLIREKMVEAQKNAAHVIRHDIALAVADVPSFLEKASQLVQLYTEKHRLHVTILPFGHLGDGNIHFNLLTTEPIAELHRALHDLLHEMGGTFSAEHGIGQARLGEMPLYKSKEELDVMRKMKQALDPHNILNPGKVIPLSADQD